MKKFFIQDVKEGSQQAAYMFIAINLVWFVGGIAELDYGVFENVLQLFWSFSLVGILLGLKDLQGDTVPEDWRQGCWCNQVRRDDATCGEDGHTRSRPP